MSLTPETGKDLLLITPPYHCGVVEVAGRWAPLNLLYVAEAARRGGANPTLYDAMTLFVGWDDIRAELEKRRPAFVASYAITATINHCMTLGRLVKEVLPEAQYILGGVHPTFMWQEILGEEDSPVDFIVRGEGEVTMEELMRALIDGGDPGTIPGIACRNAQGETHVGPARVGFLDDLEEYPAAHDLLDWPIYKYFPLPEGRLGSVATSRGCNFTCTFCSQQVFWSRSWRGRAPDKVVAEIEMLYSQHGVRTVLLTDEYPTAEQDRWEELLDRIIALGHDDMHLLMETRAADIVRDKSFLWKYRKAGIIHVYVGLEATDQDVLDRINKQSSVEEGRESLRLIRDYGMLSETSFVLGFPEETEESVQKTLEDAKYFDPDMGHFLAITPWPYSDLYRDMKDHIEVWDYSEYNLIEPIIKPIAMSLVDIDKAIIRCYREFYMAKMPRFLEYKDPFLRKYILTSMKLIMKSSFIVNKLGRLGMPKAMAKILAMSNPSAAKCPMG